MVITTSLMARLGKKGAMMLLLMMGWSSHCG